MTRTYAAHARPLWQRVLLTREMAIVAALVLVVGYSLARVPNFNSPLTLPFLLLDATPILLVALPMTLVIVTGEIDLSVASVVGLGSVMVGVLVQAGWSLPLAALVAVLVGAGCGLLNGYLVAYVGLPSLAVTIGTLALFRGIAVGLLGTKAVTDFPDRWTSLATDRISGTQFPLVTIPIVVLIAGFAVLLHATPFGRGVYDIGRSIDTAHFSGVAVARTKLVLFLLSGVVSAFAGVFFTLRYGSSRGDNATGLELQVVAAVLLGGVSIFGGRGALHGVIAGVLLIGVISSALRLESVTVNVINIIIGALLVLSVISPSVLGWLVRRRQRPSAVPAPSTGGGGLPSPA